MKNNLETPLVTIGTTCYNAADTIARAVESAVAQDWPSREIIIVDDSSTDNSAEISADIAQAHKDVRLIKHTENGGPAKARQTILDHARGEFIAFFDDDDVSDPERIKLQVARIQSYEQQSGVNLIACYASGRRLYENGYVFPFTAIGAQEQVPIGTDVADRLLFFESKPGVFYGGGTPTCTLMARKATFEAVGGFDPMFRRVEDIDFAVRLALVGGHFIGCPEALVTQHATQALDKSPEKNLEAELQLVEKHKTYLTSVNRYVYAKKWPYLRYFHFKRHYFRLLTTLLQLLLRYPFKTTSQFLYTAPRRLIHELKMRKKVAV